MCGYTSLVVVGCYQTVVMNIVLHGVGATSLTGMSALTILYTKNHMYGHSQLLFSLTSGSEAAGPKHGKMGGGDRTIARTHYCLYYFHKS